MAELKRINNKKDLIELENQLGVRHDWHEPDEQEVTARAFGETFDNAGFWGLNYVHSDEYPSEMYVVLYLEGRPIAEVNLATLFSLACS